MFALLAVISFFGGIDFAFAAAPILGSFVWHKSRPKPPTPWNRKAITATYDLIDTGDENHIVIFPHLVAIVTKMF